MVPEIVYLADLRQRIADLLHQEMGIEPNLVLSDAPFTELHKDFDSLSFLELQLLLEKAYGVELEEPASPDPALLPKNCTELAVALHAQLVKKGLVV